MNKNRLLSLKNRILVCFVVFYCMFQTGTSLSFAVGSFAAGGSGNNETTNGVQAQVQSPARTADQVQQDCEWAQQVISLKNAIEEGSVPAYSSDFKTEHPLGEFVRGVNIPPQNSSSRDYYVKVNGELQRDRREYKDAKGRIIRIDRYTYGDNPGKTSELYYYDVKGNFSHVEYTDHAGYLTKAIYYKTTTVPPGSRTFAPTTTVVASASLYYADGHILTRIEDRTTAGLKIRYYESNRPNFVKCSKVEYYNKDNTISKTEFANGDKDLYYYTSGRLERIDKVRGNRTHKEYYDPSGKIAKIETRGEKGLVSTANYSYKGNGKLDTITHVYSNGQRFKRECYDSRGNVFLIFTYAADNSIKERDEFFYNAVTGKLERVEYRERDAVGKFIKIDYYLDNLSAAFDPNKPVTRYFNGDGSSYQEYITASNKLAQVDYFDKDGRLTKTEAYDWTRDWSNPYRRLIGQPYVYAGICFKTVVSYNPNGEVSDIRLYNYYGHDITSVLRPEPYYPSHQNSHRENIETIYNINNHRSYVPTRAIYISINGTVYLVAWKR